MCAALSTDTIRPPLYPGEALNIDSKGKLLKFHLMRNCIARQKACAYVEQLNSSIISATSIFTGPRGEPLAISDVNVMLNIASSWALMAARGWARHILDCRRDLISDRPNRASLP